MPKIQDVANALILLDDKVIVLISFAEAGAFVGIAPHPVSVVFALMWLDCLWGKGLHEAGLECFISWPDFTHTYIYRERDSR